VVRELHNSEPEIRKTSAWILGKASQNNALVQNQATTGFSLSSIIWSVFLLISIMVYIFAV